MSKAILKLSNGTTEINLINPVEGIHLKNWRPKVAGYKSGGVFQDSPLAPGRRLVYKQFENPIETFEFAVDDLSSDALAARLSDLLALLEQASDYWTGPGDTPVYLIARSKNETNTRYALIHLGRVPELGSPYDQPFLQPGCRRTIDAATLLIERGQWLGLPPGDSSGTEASGLTSYDGRTLGRAATTATEVHVANKQNVANLSDVFYYDASTAAYSVNLMNAALPVNLFPAVPAAGDIIYFGIDTTLADSGPFDAVVFDIGTAQTNITDIVWEFYSSVGPGWVSLATVARDNTVATGGSDPFTQTGVCALAFERKQLTTWITVAINGVTGFWIRARITAVGANPTPPTQQNRPFYTPVLPYVDIAADQVGGDIPALLRVRLNNVSGQLNQTDLSTAVMGLRSYDRGADFTAYLNLADEQNPAGLTVTATGGGFVTSSTAPTGRALQHTLAGGAQEVSGYVTFTANMVKSFYGVFHVYLRGKQVSGSAGNILARVYTANYSITLYTSAWGQFTTPGSGATPIDVIDLGVLTIPGFAVSDATAGVYQFAIGVELKNTTAATSIVTDLYDIILIPVDECAASVNTDIAGYETGSNWQILSIDSVNNPKMPVFSELVRLETGVEYWVVTYTTISTGEVFLQTNARQRLWFLFHDNNYCPPEIFCTVQLFKQQRYLYLRGNK